MKTIKIYSPGSYSKLILEPIITPIKPAADEVVVQTRASGINYADICVRWGIYESAKKFVGWPITPGFEFAGIVQDIGAHVHDFKLGDAVFGITLFNGYSGQIVVKNKHLFKIPEGFSFEQMAAFPAVYLTAYHGLLQNFMGFSGMKILIHSAAGGVGGALLQLCRVKNYQSCAIVGSPHKVNKAQSLGAQKVIDKSKENWKALAREFAEDGFDVIFDANGVETLKASYELLRPTGKLMVYGFHTMLPKTGGRLNWIKLAFNYLRTPRFNPLNLTTQNKSVMAFNLSFLFERDDLFVPAIHELIEWLKEGKIQAPEVTTYKLSDVGKAHQAIESGQTTGKLVLLHDD
jgi:synaptic vesicle membrane protein VAT-1